MPAVASIVGVAPVLFGRAGFNTSYTSTLEVTATYRCFLAAARDSRRQETFELAPRESLAFDDMAADAFGAPNSAGGVEFDVLAGGHG